MFISDFRCVLTTTYQIVQDTFALVLTTVEFSRLTGPKGTQSGKFFGGHIVPWAANFSEFYSQVGTNLEACF